MRLTSGRLTQQTLRQFSAASTMSHIKFWHQFNLQVWTHLSYGRQAAAVPKQRVLACWHTFMLHTTVAAASRLCSGLQVILQGPMTVNFPGQPGIILGFSSN